jgi:diacylglycerol O-acyltransferase
VRQLSHEDAAFLYADNDHSNANVTLVLIYDPTTCPAGRLRFQDLLHHVASRLHRLPLFRQKLLRVPLELDTPYWVEDDRFDLEYHVRHVALPEPGDWRQFCIQASRIHARPLDVTRPLWELYLVDRLDAFDQLPRDSFALLLKLHHAAVDSDEGADVATLLHDLVPDAPPAGPAEPWFASAPPGPADVLLRTLQHNISEPLSSLRPLVRALTGLAPRVVGLVGDAVLHPERFPTARFNAEVSPHRVFETRRFEAAQIERIRVLVRGATWDDVVLAICGGGLRRYLELHDELPKAGLVALTTPSLDGATHPPGRRTWLRRSVLATDVASPLARLRAVHRARVESERRLRKELSSSLEEATQHAPGAAVAVAARSLHTVTLAASRGIPVANCTIVNAPGPTAPLYLGGAKMTYYSAMMPVADGLGLTIAVTRYEDRLVLSPTACREHLPDPRVFAQCLRDEFQSLLAIADTPARARKPRRPAAKKAARTGPARVKRTASGAGRASPATSAPSAPRATSSGATTVSERPSSRARGTKSSKPSRARTTRARPTATSYDSPPPATRDR